MSRGATVTLMVTVVMQTAVANLALAQAAIAASLGPDTLVGDCDSIFLVDFPASIDVAPA